MKIQLCLFAFASVITANSLWAQGNEGMFSGSLPDNWTADVVAALKYTRNHYDNWGEGGTNASSWIAEYNADTKGHWTAVDWRILSKLAWGNSYLDGIGNRKSVDKIFFETTLDYNGFGVLKPYLGARFESQFTTGYVYTDSTSAKVSCFMDPGYLTQVVGLSYAPNENFSQRLAFANRMTISEGYGWADDKETAKVETFKDEPGLESVTEYKLDVSSLVVFKTRLWAFVNFESVDAIDGKWENSLAVALAPLIELSIGIDLAYDKDISEDHQYKDAVLLGITWRWF